MCNCCAVTNVANGRWLADKSDAVLESIRLGQRYGANSIEFHDNNFGERTERVGGLIDFGIVGGEKGASTPYSSTMSHLAHNGSEWSEMVFLGAKKW